jgi:hypothetical protein
MGMYFFCLYSFVDQKICDPEKDEAIEPMTQLTQFSSTKNF